MAGRIRDEDIAAVRERCAIDAVIGDHLQLHSAGGGSMKALCPFHDEKTPSFNVTPTRGLYYCFSCGEGGDVIRFVQKMDGLDFTEAVERLAARAGISLRYEQGGYVPGRERSSRARLLEAHRAAAAFYAERLSAGDAAAARAFLSERHFTPADAQRFGVGYAPAGWDELARHLRGRGFTDAELTLGGLVREGRRGLVDRFRDRLVWPVRDLSGDVGPKYLNSPETPLFRKSSMLYGADLAKREIARRRQAVVVEGYTDVMACHLAGVPTAVATCGTAFGGEHVKILRRLVADTDGAPGEVIFTFDGDSAGRDAALRAFGMEEKFVTQTFVAAGADGLDPCDLRLARGDAAVRDLVARRVPLFEFAIRAAVEKHNLDTTEGQLAALDEAAPIVARIKDAGLRARYAVNLDRWLGLMDERFVLDRVRSHAGRRSGDGRAAAAGRRHPGGRGARDGAETQESDRDGRGRSGSPARHGGDLPRGERPPGPRRTDQSSREGHGAGEADRNGADTAGRGPDRAAPGPATADPLDSGDPRDPVVQVEREALKLAVQRPGACGPEFDALPPESFTAPAHVAVCRVVAGCGGTVAATGDDGGRGWVAKLRESAPDDRVRTLVTALAVEPLRAAGEPDEHYVGAVLARVGELAVSREIAVAKSRLQRMNPVREQAEYNRLFGELVTLEQRRKALVERAVGA